MISKIEELNKKYVIVADKQLIHEFYRNPKNDKGIFPYKIFLRERFINNDDYRELMFIEEYGRIFLGIYEIEKDDSIKHEDFEQYYFFKYGFIIKRNCDPFGYEVEVGDRFDFYKNFEKYDRYRMIHRMF